MHDLLHLDSKGWPKSCHFAKARTETYLRFCKKCAQEQRKHYSVSWWMRDLNLPMVSVCPLHRTRLSYVTKTIALTMSGFLPHELDAQAKQIAGGLDEGSIRAAEFVITLCKNSALVDSGQVHNFVEKFTWKVRMEAYLHFCKYTAARTTPPDSYVPRYETLDLGISRDHARRSQLMNRELSMITIERGGKGLTGFTYVDDANSQLRALTKAEGMHDVIERLLKVSRFHKLQIERTERFVDTLKNRCKAQFDCSAGETLSIEILLLHVLDRNWIIRLMTSKLVERRPFLKLSDTDILVGMYIVHRSLLSFKRELGENLERCPFIKQKKKSAPLISVWGISLYQSWVNNIGTFLAEMHRKGSACLS